ncbi:hypothetical protein QQS21_007498 [Conoideocrella luteorostrata]|uniref:tRNA synthetases class I catalytic domain-containing protein n=1 Tax=Conoideocrella luteorostrata TaxID=1105319 RepID=A0AAJ0FZF6_9HYPO|nr:hypothetical protein QQS21_007498 [Conoideocrella luteorostrata]
MNITDVDDKIILRSRHLHLGARLLNELNSRKTNKAKADALAVGKEGLKFYISRNLPLLSPDTSFEFYGVESKKAYSIIVDWEATDAALLSDFLDQAKDAMHPYLDHFHGSTIDNTDHSLFSAVARKYVDRYFEEVHALNVLDPDILTHATEYIPQMIASVQRIVDKMFAYPTDDGSIYFDILAFKADDEGSLANKSASNRKQPIYTASKLRDGIRQQVLSKHGNIDYGLMIKWVNGVSLGIQSSTPANSDTRYHVVAAQFRNDIHHLASESNILSLCDTFRDVHLRSIDIYLEDRENAPALVRPLDQSMRKALAEMRAATEATQSEKVKRKAEEAEKQRARDNKATVNPSDDQE